MKQDDVLVTEMIENLRRLACGEVSREFVEQWVCEAHKDHGGSVMTEHRTAAMVLDALGCLTEPDRDGGLIVRESDLAGYLDWLLTGIEVGWDEFAYVRMSLSELLEQTGVPSFRFWWHGLGWFEMGWFASRETGFRFAFATPCPSGQGYEAGLARIFVPPGSNRTRAFTELFESLAIDHRDCEREAELEEDFVGLSWWQLWRNDDNGNDFLVEEFSSKAKAVKALRAFEAGHHRQTYSLTARPSEPS